MNAHVETKIEKDERKITFWILNSILHDEFYLQPFMLWLINEFLSLSPPETCPACNWQPEHVIEPSGNSINAAVEYLIKAEADQEKTSEKHLELVVTEDKYLLTDYFSTMSLSNFVYFVLLKATERHEVEREKT